MIGSVKCLQLLLKVIPQYIRFMTTRGVPGRRPPIDAVVYSTENVTCHRLVEFGISLVFVLRVRTLLDHDEERISMQF